MTTYRTPLLLFNQQATGDPRTVFVSKSSACAVRHTDTLLRLKLQAVFVIFNKRYCGPCVSSTPAIEIAYDTETHVRPFQGRGHLFHVSENTLWFRLALYLNWSFCYTFCCPQHYIETRVYNPIARPAGRPSCTFHGLIRITLYGYPSVSLQFPKLASNINGNPVFSPLPYPLICHASIVLLRLLNSFKHRIHYLFSCRHSSYSAASFRRLRAS